ncbi:penicillin-binding protein 1A [Cupriavidus pauculus]|uniref:penicillin-binding protein 1A n=1 Tax=Cupriavidus pauculus TaxID=82633 RepID=UPI001479471E|nr:PBP1A family penicillin-binding protein [Cupriavidus pauculus]MCM3605843.1 PBP1A family penicillin-binding protein [Cupriavidus pauculus]UAL02198.1 PBP1A family penicillin-binding protein [Cupriavidus pauculus]
MKNLAVKAAGVTAALAAAGVLLAGFAAVISLRQLPSVEALRDYRPQVPLRVFTRDDVLIGEFGTEHREFIPIERMPKLMSDALLAAEDDQFYNHVGVDIPGLIRAALANIGEGYAQGASTITMQVARNFYLSREKTLSRKWYEILLAFEIDRSLPKERILELYMNQVYLGEHAYGFGSAAQTYFGKPLAQLSLAQTAMLAGLPKAPSTMNPVVNLPRAKRRQEYVLGRMLALGMITQDQYREARNARIVVSRDTNGRFDGHAEYVAELARQLAHDRFGDEAYTRGINVYTTVSLMHQVQAFDAVQAGIDRYGKRHGSAKGAVALPQAALVSLDARTGAIEAMVGGTDFDANRFNHATQAQRQPGSTFKPFIYSAALERGISPGTLINDAPLDNSPRWQPSNDDGRFVGPISVRQALAESRNLPAIRTLQAIGIPYAIDFAGKFGFSTKRLPPYLPMALGTGTTSPLRLAAAYGVFANQGHRIEPYLIEKITDGDGNVLFAADTSEPPRVISERNAFVMNSLLQSVVDEGTGNGVKRYLRRDDVAGKTGTTNDAVDGWFAGYAGQVVTVAWMGFDDNRSLGRHEFGATTALPIWAAYMEGRLAGVPDTEFRAPPQLARLNNDWAYAENADGTHGIAALGFPPPAAADIAPDGGVPGAPSMPGPTPAALGIPAPVAPPRPAGNPL